MDTSKIKPWAQFFRDALLEPIQAYCELDKQSLLLSRAKHLSAREILEVGFSSRTPAACGKAELYSAW